jgi:deoxycytidylate deaminase
MTRRETRDLADGARTQLRLEHAIRLANRSTFKRFRTGAVIFQKDKCVGTGWSHYSVLNLNRYLISIHAELHAVLRSAQRRELFGSTIYVARKSVKSGNIGLSKPCDECASVLHEAGVAEVYYTINGSNDYGHLTLSP